MKDQKPKSLQIIKPSQPEQSQWQKLIKGIIRPPRSVYKQTSLGSKQFVLNETRYERLDFDLLHKEKSISITLYQPEYQNGWIILYLHGNSSSRLECTSIIKFLPHRFSLASFDFIGCGLNKEGDNISLGVRESQQVKTVANFFKKKDKKIILWGRSMGAATALKYGQASIIIADSSFTSFKNLCKSVAKDNAPKMLPLCFISCLFPCVFCKLRSDIKEKGQYDVEDLDIKENLSKISPETMIVFMSGDDDKLINKAHSQKLFKVFSGSRKYLQIFKGTHNTKRPQQTIKKVMGYITAHIKYFQQLQKKQPASKTKIEIDFYDD